MNGIWVLMVFAIGCSETDPPPEVDADPPATPQVQPASTPDLPASTEAPSPAATDSMVTSDAVGPVSLAMTEAEIVAALGDAAVRRSDAYVGEGYCAPGSLLFGDTEGAIQVMWSDSTFSTMTRMVVDAAESPWRTPRGVGIGTSLLELEDIAGEPVAFSGFGWDYGGSARWEEGDVSIAMVLLPTHESEDAVVSHPRYTEVLGEGTVMSDHPVVRQMDVRVVRLMVLGGGVPQTEYLCPGIDTP